MAKQNNLEISSLWILKCLTIACRDFFTSHKSVRQCLFVVFASLKSVGLCLVLIDNFFDLLVNFYRYFQLLAGSYYIN